MQFLTTFTKLTARFKNFLMNWLLVLGIKEGLLECATVCVKSEVILSTVFYLHGYFYKVLKPRMQRTDCIIIYMYLKAFS